ncbi:hypothetical protein GCM10007933_23010 [Zoogloea oryzae]|uniref:Phage tail tape measure protein n=1 Tax=Zoogloea oryzae TaxID=310767 RepID=A0ABQ6FB60_9RHOO|nr:hypothetical protein [Zoogloea oryzae]GLT22840.1 hypothetical protein GCM10007933_23010 [Zoogloea oryzae]
MAILSDDEIRLRLAFETEGGGMLSKLAADVDSLAANAGEAAPKFNALSSEIRSIGQQKIQIDGLQAAMGVSVILCSRRS